MRELSEMIRLFDRIERETDRIPQTAATLAVNFSKDRFREQNWVDHRTEPWPKRKTQDKRKGRALLVDSARLKRSIRKVEVNRQRAVIGSDVPYAAAHNYGFRGTAKVKRHSRQGHTVRAHSRKVNLPKRQYLGTSYVLETGITRQITANLVRAMKRR